MPDGHAAAATHAHAQTHEAGHHPRLMHHFDSLEQQKESSTLGMWTFLITEIMFFGGLFLLYTVYRVQNPEAFAAASRELDIPLGLFNTVVLIGSSFTMALGVHAAALGKRRAVVGWLLATVLLGSLFLGVKVVEYSHKFEHHLVPGPGFAPPEAHFDPTLKRGAEVYFSLYFAMTGLHAVHMILGIPVLLVLAVLAHRGYFDRRYSTPIELFGLYWHFVDIIWIFLFPLLYLIDPRGH
jgi:cytochrome c oxidase subunit 3